MGNIKNTYREYKEHKETNGGGSSEDVSEVNADQFPCFRVKQVIVEMSVSHSKYPV